MDWISESSWAEGCNRSAVEMARGVWLLSSQPVGSPGSASAQGWRHLDKFRFGCMLK